MSDLLTNIATCSLTLYNKYDEAYTAGKITTLIHTKNKIRVRWATPTKMNNVSPFTGAFLHTGRRIFKVLEIKPVLEHEVSEIELVYD